MSQVVVSFDIGGVLDANPTAFRTLIQTLRRDGIFVGVVSALPFNDPRRWGFTDQERRAANLERLKQLGLSELVTGDYSDWLFKVTPDPDGPTGPLTGMYKNEALRVMTANLHVDDNPHVAAQITTCPVVMYSHPSWAGFSVNFANALAEAKTKAGFPCQE